MSGECIRFELLHRYARRAEISTVAYTLNLRFGGFHCQVQSVRFRSAGVVHSERCMNSFSRKMKLALAREETDVRRAQSSTGFAAVRATIELAHGNATARTNRNSSVCRVRSRVGKFYGERHVAREIVYVVCGELQCAYARPEVRQRTAVMGIPYCGGRVCSSFARTRRENQITRHRARGEKIRSPPRWRLETAPGGDHASQQLAARPLHRDAGEAGDAGSTGPTGPTGTTGSGGPTQPNRHDRFRWTDRTDIPPVNADSITAFATPTIAAAKIRRFERSLVQSFEVLRLS
jgi:hypothetical protein